MASTAGLGYLVLVLGVAWWQGDEIWKQEWMPGVLGLFMFLMNLTIYLQVKGRRRRWKQRYPKFFRDDDEQTDDWP